MPKLKITMPDGSEVTHELTDETVTLGRVAENMIQIEHASVSSRHAQLSLDEGGNYRLDDLNSTNGTRVNGNSVVEANLKHGDRVRFGQIETSYLGENADAHAPLPAAAEPEAEVAVETHKPTNFTNASPFQKKSREIDTAGKIIMAATGLAILLFIVALVMVFQLQPPVAS